ncbi:MAG: DUF86 domain-containing protein [Euryarchaeota archaeon]|nr:DUF86 domain-containing protein [Euryarchaeota archaeon]
MERRERDRLLDVLDAAREAVALSSGRSRGDLDEDRTLALSLTRLLEVVGEAAKHVGEPTRNTLPGVPWRKIAGMRDKLIHAYFEVDLDVVWRTVAEELPTLVRELEGILEKKGP